MKKTTKSLNTSSTSRCSKQKQAKRYGQPIQELIELYGITPKQAISTYYGWRANL